MPHDNTSSSALLKRCSRCKEYKPATTEFFGKDKSRKYGVTHQCKACRKQYERGRVTVYEPPVDPADAPHKICPKCKGEFPATPEYFFRNRSNKNGLGHYCKSCDTANAATYNVGEKARARKTKWQRKNPDYNREYFLAHTNEITESHRRYRARTPDRQRRYAKTYRTKKPFVGRAAKARFRASSIALDANFTAQDWQAALDHFGGICAVCGRPPGLFHTLAMDHWIPLSSPDCPGTVPGNIIPLCHGTDGCNNSKGNKPAAEWLVAKFGKRKAAIILARIEVYFESIRND